MLFDTLVLVMTSNLIPNKYFYKSYLSSKIVNNDNSFDFNH
jgi:hypothetical protein